MSELTRFLGLDTLPAAGLHIDVEADATECRAVARRLDLIDLTRLTARVDVTHGPRADVSIVRGRIRADAVQRCVVTLEPLSVRVEETFERYFLLGAGNETAAGGAEIVVSADDEEPEPLNEPMLDVGEIVVEEFSLALDPYPRSPESDETMRGFEAGNVDRAHPFDALGKWRRLSEG